MDMFGISQAIQYIERQMNNIQFAKTKEDIRNCGSNSLILMENILKEMLHIYGYLFFRDDYKQGLINIVDLNERLMFGKILYSLSKLNSLLPDIRLRDEFSKYFDRPFVVFRYNDRYYSILSDCSRARAVLLHDLLDEAVKIYSLEQYKKLASDAIYNSFEALKYFKEANIFPSMVMLKNYYLENGQTTCNFIDEIDSIIPMNIKEDVSRVGGSNWYLFRNSKRHILIPAFIRLNALMDSEAGSGSLDVELDHDGETAAPLGFLKISGRDEMFSIASDHISIGRALESSICIEKRSISRKHCSIDVSGDKACITDLGSKFGTMLNGSRIAPQTQYELKPHDEIVIGFGAEETKIVYFA